MLGSVHNDKFNASHMGFRLQLNNAQTVFHIWAGFPARRRKSVLLAKVECCQSLFRVGVNRCQRRVGEVVEGFVWGTTVCMTPHGHFLSRREWGSPVHSFSLRTGTCKCTLEGHVGQVCAVAAMGSRQLVSGSTDNAIKMWNVDTGMREGVRVLGFERGISGAGKGICSTQ